MPLAFLRVLSAIALYGCLLHSASAQNLSSFASGFDRAQDMAQLSDGRVLITDFGSDVVRAFAADGTEQTSFATVTSPWGVLELADGRVLISEVFGGVLAFEGDGTSLGTFASPGSVRHMVQLADGRVLMGTDAGAVQAYDTAGNALGAFVSGLNNDVLPYQLADGRVLVSEPTGQRILEYQADGTPLGTFATLSFPVGNVVELTDGRVLAYTYALNLYDVIALTQQGEELGVELELQATDRVIQLQDGRVLFINQGIQVAAQLLPRGDLEGVQGYRMLTHHAGGPISELFRTTHTQGFPGSADPTPSDGFCSVYTYNEAAASYEGGYTCVSGLSESVPRMRGMLAYVYKDDDPATSGVQGGFPKTLHAYGRGASVSRFILTYTDDPDRPVSEEGWHLLGNPHKSAMDWDDVNWSNVTDVAYVYDPNYLGGDYRTWSRGAASGDLTDGVIPYMQGFFVKATAPARIGEPPAMLGVSLGTYGLTDETSAQASLRFSLSVVSDGAQTETSAAFVAAVEGAALGIDDFDGYRLTPGAWPRAVLSTFADGDDGVPIALATNALPADASGEIAVPVEIAAEGYAEGLLALNVTWSGALPEGWTATLIDRETGARVAVEPGASHMLMLDVPATKAAVRPVGLGLDMAPPSMRANEKDSAGGAVSSGDRLALVLTPASVVSTGDAPEAAFGLGAPAPNPARGLVRMPYTLSASGEATVTVYDALGREVATLASGAHAEGSHEATLDAGVLAPGVYVVRLATPEASSTARFTVMR